MAGMAGCGAGSGAQDLTELRLLVELAAVRKLADRGLSDHELAVARKLADATMRMARSGDVPGYLHADMDFHLYLLGLTGDPVLSQIARHLLAAGQGPRGEQSGRLMTGGAREHRELVNMLTDDMVNVADDLLRHHICTPWTDTPAPVLAGRRRAVKETGHGGSDEPGRYGPSRQRS